MKQTRKILVIGTASVLAIGAAAGVFARGGFGPGWGGHPGMMMGGPGMMMGADPVAFTDQRLADLKTRLAITAEQETAWNAYAEAAKAKATLMAGHREAMLSPTGVTPDQRLGLHQQGLEQMQKVLTTTRDLYAVLTPEQQAQAGGLVGPGCGRGRGW